MQNKHKVSVACVQKGKIMKLEKGWCLSKTDLRLHHRGSLGSKGVVKGDGVAKNTAGIPTAAVLLPFTHQQVWDQERQKRWRTWDKEPQEIW